MDKKGVEAVALSIRSLSMDAIQKANSGHPGLPLGAAEAAAVLYGEVMKHNPADSKWADRDRFVLSAGSNDKNWNFVGYTRPLGRPLFEALRAVR